MGMKQRRSKSTKWTAERLELLYDQYNMKYWNGALPKYTVLDRVLTDCVGLCNYERKEVSVNTAAHNSDQEVRETLLHEMAHVADESRSSHGYGFWGQIEMLLVKGARMSLGCSEMPGQHEIGIDPDMIPASLPFCRRAVAKFAKKQHHQLMEIYKSNPGPIHEIGDDEIIAWFEECEGLGWKMALASANSKFGLLDIAGSPRNEWATDIVKKGKAAHKKARDKGIADRQYWERVEALTKTP